MDDNAEYREDRKVIEAASPGPWINEVNRKASHVSRVAVKDPTSALGFRRVAYMAPPGCRGVRDDQAIADGDFVAMARERWPAALDEIDRLRQILERHGIDPDTGNRDLYLPVDSSLA